MCRVQKEGIEPNMAIIYNVGPENTVVSSSFGTLSVAKAALELTAQSTQTIRAVGIYALIMQGSPSDNLRLKIYEGGTTPENGTLIFTAVDYPIAALHDASWTDGYQLLTLFFIEPQVTLNSGTKYYFTLTRTGSLSNTDHPGIRLSNGVNVPPGYLAFSNYWNANWTEVTSAVPGVILFTEEAEIHPVFYNTNDNSSGGTIATTGPMILLDDIRSSGYIVGTSNPSNINDEASYFFVLYLSGLLGISATAQLFTGADMPSAAEITSFIYGTTAATASGGVYTIGSNTYTVHLLSETTTTTTTSSSSTTTTTTTTSTTTTSTSITPYSGLSFSKRSNFIINTKEH